MKISSQNTSKGAEEGRFMHLREVGTGRYLYNVDEDGDDIESEPCGLTLRGAESKQARKAVAAHQRNRAKSGPQSKSDDDVVARAIVLEFHNIENDDGKPLDARNSDDIEWFFDQSSEFVRQAIEFVRKPGNFLAAE